MVDLLVKQINQKLVKEKRALVKQIREWQRKIGRTYKGDWKVTKNDATCKAAQKVAKKDIGL